MDKRGQTGILIGIISIIVILFLLSMAYTYSDTIKGWFPNSGEEANTGTKGPAPGTIFYSALVDWLGFGQTWAVIVSSLMVLLILISGTYDVLLGFSMFNNKSVIMLISIGIGVIGAVSGAVRTMALFFFNIAAGFGAASIAFGIIVPFFIFMIFNILFYRMFKELRTKKTTADIQAGATEAAAALEGLGSVAKGMKRAAGRAEN